MIYQKLAKIQAAVKGLTKDTKAYSYKYVDGNKCLASIRPLMVEYGLLLMPEVREISTKEVTYKVWNDKAKSLVDKTEVLVTIKMQMTWVDSEDGEMWTFLLLQEMLPLNRRRTKKVAYSALWMRSPIGK